MKKLFIATLLFGSFMSLSACNRNTSTTNMASSHHSSTVPGVPSTNSTILPSTSTSSPDISTSPIISPSISINTPDGSHTATHS